MTEKEFYDRIGGDYSDALNRLMRDSLIRKFVLKFRDDPNFAELKAALAGQRWDEAFSAAHTLKGVALNLAFARLSAAMVALTDSLRPQNRDALEPAAVETLFAAAEQEYEAVLAAIELLAGNNP